jgi:RNA polymerase sigma factor (sigma-70 family)
MHELGLERPAAHVSNDDALQREFQERLAESATLAFRVAYAVLRHREDAEDVAQEAMVQAYRSFARLQDRGAFRSWLVRIAWRTALNRRRRDARRASRELAVADPPAGASVEDLMEIGDVIADLVDVHLRALELGHPVVDHVDAPEQVVVMVDSGPGEHGGQQLRGRHHCIGELLHLGEETIDLPSDQSTGGTMDGGTADPVGPIVDAFAAEPRHCSLLFEGGVERTEVDLGLGLTTERREPALEVLVEVGRERARLPLLPDAGGELRHQSIDVGLILGHKPSILGESPRREAHMSGRPRWLT